MKRFGDEAENCARQNPAEDEEDKLAHMPREQHQAADEDGDHRCGSSMMLAQVPTSDEAAKAVGNFLGLPPLSTADLGRVAAVAVIVLTVFLLTRFFAKRLCKWLERKVAPRFDLTDHRFTLASPHVAAMVAAMAAIALLNIAAAAYSWPPYPALLLDLAIATATGFAAFHAARAFNLSGSAAFAIGALCALAVLASRYEQLDWVAKSLDRFAVSFGDTHISLLDLINLVLAAIVLYGLARIANRGAKAFIRRRTNLDITQSLLAEKLAAMGIVVIAIFVAIDMLGIDTTALSIFSGTIGLGLGFGLQKIFSNLVSGIILLMDRSIKPGDVIVVGEAVGKVNRIGTRAVSVITRDGKEYLIPNELLMTERVENWAFSSRNVRVRLSVTVASDSDLDLVERLMKESAVETKRVLDSPQPVVWITDLNGAGITHELRFWITDPEDGLGNIQGKIYRRIIAKFQEHDIRLPNPARDIAITKLPPIMKNVE